jgi:hypothetical protein
MERKTLNLKVQHTTAMDLQVIFNLLIQQIAKILQITKI